MEDAISRVLVFLLLILPLACSDKSEQKPQSVFLTAEGKGERSTTVGNLITTAMKEVHDLDIVLYPVDLLDEKKSFYLHGSPAPAEIEYVAELYPYGPEDRFIIGTMKGKDIKKFILSRSRIKYKNDLEVEGIRYDIGFVAGVPSYQLFSDENGRQLIDDDYYRVAVSDYFYFSGASFPGYKYGNGMNFSLDHGDKFISARESVKAYLQSGMRWPHLADRRAHVRNTQRGATSGSYKISAIQGETHMSPLWGHEVTTFGVVTASAISDWYPGGLEIYIQDPQPDNNLKTSEAIHVYFEEEGLDIRRGDLLEIRGTVYESMTDVGMSRTSLRDVTHWKVLSRENSMPETVQLGSWGRSVPKDHISTYHGNLNLKPTLNLSDGIDFWESLEGMRVSVKDLRVVGFRGGQESFQSNEVKGYLNVYFVPDGYSDNKGDSVNKGIIADTKRKDFNPEVMVLITNHFTKGVDTDTIFNVGDVIHGKVTGVLGYETNIFGEGHYALMIPEEQETLKQHTKSVGKDFKTLPERPQSQLKTGTRQLKIATYNLENLAGNMPERLEAAGRAIAINLGCPDILNLVEVQDANGDDFDGDSGAEITLQRLIAAIPCENKSYASVNVDPLLHGEGGKPGGNIRVAMIYDKNKLTFEERPAPSPLAETFVRKDGRLSYNPGRVFPNDTAFNRSRRSLIAEFLFQGERIYLIGNHLNSKLGDISPWSAEQPPSFKSENRRALMAGRLNDFVERLVLRNPQANVVVLGDFNAYVDESSMRVLQGDILFNMAEELLAPNDRYTTNYNGNSMPLDYIFVNQKLMQRNPRVEIIHMNSDYMGRLSDHDPVVSQFDF